jgi:hypothetical protein
MRFNPKLDTFLEQKPDITLIGLCWSITWRFTAAVYGALFAFLLLITILNALVS